jgi:hypothetical protein
MKNLMLFVLTTYFSVIVYGQKPRGEDFNDYGNPNVTASRLVGTWRTNIAMSERLLGKSLNKTDTISFLQDSTVKKIIPAKYSKFIKGKRIYLSGYMILDKAKLPFLLMETDGNTRVIFFMDRRGVKYDNEESFILFIAVSDDKRNDLLCTGADFNNDPFRCWDRID